jgi:RNA polymerase sigma-70 factor (TIGR02960 family)
MAMTTLDLLTRAQGGDDAAFQALTDPHRRELLAHCYRMLGSFQDAEDALQDVTVTAWRGIGGFAGRASLRTWLYRIATNRCLNMKRDAARRPPLEWNVPGVVPPEPTRLGEVVWLQPFPDALMEGLSELPAGPEARYEQRESMSLAFVTALQVLPPRQLAVLVLRDVLGFSALEVSEMLEVSLDAANSALKRARAGLARSRRLPPAARADDDDALAARFVTAYESADVDAIVGLLTDAVFMSMPPMPLEYVGRDAVREFLMLLFGAGRRHSLVPARANGQPAFGAYLRGPDGLRHAAGLFVVEVRGDAISALTRFEAGVLGWFGLPRTLP